MVIISKNAALLFIPQGTLSFGLPSSYGAVASYRAGNVSCSRTLQQTGRSRPNHAVSLTTRWEKTSAVISPVTGNTWAWRTVVGAICFWKPAAWGDIKGLNRSTKQFRRRIWPVQCDARASWGEKHDLLLLHFLKAQHGDGTQLKTFMQLFSYAIT